MRELIEAAGTTLLYLPPYSPDFNPIEQVFAKLKAQLRRAAECTIHGLRFAIGRILDLYTLAECANYFAHCGYDADRSENVLSATLQLGRTRIRMTSSSRRFVSETRRSAPGRVPHDGRLRSGQ